AAHCAYRASDDDRRNWYSSIVCCPFGGEAPGRRSCGPAIKSLGRRLALCARRLVDCSAQSLGKLDRVVIGPEVQAGQPRLLVEQVAVDRRPLDAVRAPRLDHWIDLVSRQHEVAGDGGLAAAGGLEADRRGHARGPGGSKLRSALVHRVAPRHAELIHAAIGLTLDADDLIELGGV